MGAYKRGGGVGNNLLPRKKVGLFERDGIIEDLRYLWKLQSYIRVRVSGKAITNGRTFPT